MLRHRIVRNRKGSADTLILTGVRFALGAAFVILVIFPFFGKRLVSFVGGSEANAYSIDKGFADLMTKVNCLQDETCDPADKSGIPHLFSVDNGFYLVGFNFVENTNGNAIKPPDCSGKACFCVCTDHTCQKIDAAKSRGRDCRPLPGYNAVVAQKDIKGNDGEKQPDTNKFIDGNEGYYFYIKGMNTVEIRLQRGANGNLYIRKIA